ncbi:hypothetical protein BLS_000334 [Venturia inaequalis]|uniref:Uncharacterized protein n=1 Tax=Venturia inaequalis TaxID=5025 RepID=A0A8H3U203_VENIN|nr:hypothetical protein BLS_000334 [Venturia inaequalis]KAE9969704.1 hypothetical protein EG327_010504 [Venturia inaequalis]KAE9973761.1 hypothetical protein EG328_004224 [Venturia inaequalis]RDI81198.1 hypothetical protein Vi05172_g8857 [Venturia inaequalis]
MDSIVQAILNLSKLEVSLIKIEDATADTFKMTIESKVTNTGPVSATQSALTVDMVGPAGIFGKLDLPEVKTKSSGTVVNIPAQVVKIIDHAAYQAFVKSIQLDEKLTLRLENGQGTVKALGMKSKIVYKKNVELLGMNGPKTELVKTVATDGGFKNTIKIYNPSPLEIDLGENTFEFVDDAGLVIAEQTGNLDIPRGDSYHEATGTIKGKTASSKITLVGKDVARDSWLKETIKFFNTPIGLTAEMKQLVAQ